MSLDAGQLLSVDRRTYSVTSVTLTYSQHARLNGN